MKLRLIYIFSLHLILCYGYTRFTNIKCTSLNKDLCAISVCRLKVLGRGRIAANVHIINPSPPVTESKIQVGMWRKLNGYHPFLFNLTVDYCRFMRHPNPSNVFFYMNRPIVQFSNLNHSCPIDHDILLKDLVLTDAMFERVPIPRGSYKIVIKVPKNRHWAAEVNFYMDVDVKQTLRSGADGD